MLGKALAGCGGLGCLVSILMVVAGAGMLAMMNDSHLSELGPVGMVVTPAGVLLAVFSGLALLIGIALAMRPSEE